MSVPAIIAHVLMSLNLGSHVIVTKEVRFHLQYCCVKR